MEKATNIIPVRDRNGKKIDQCYRELRHQHRMFEWIMKINVICIPAAKATIKFSKLKSMQRV